MQNLLTIELICAASGGFIGAFFAIIFNERKETFVQSFVSLLIGIIAGAGLGTRFGSDPIWCCVIGGIAGCLGGSFLEGVGKAMQENIPRATRNLMDGWVIKLGGKSPDDHSPPVIEEPEMEPEETTK